MSIEADVNAAIEADLSEQVIAGVAALLMDFAAVVQPPALLPPDKRRVYAAMVADAYHWKVISEFGHQWALVRSPFSGGKTPMVASVDLSTFTTDSSEALQLMMPAYVVERVAVLSADWKLHTTKAEGNA